MFGNLAALSWSTSHLAPSFQLRLGIIRIPITLPSGPLSCILKTCSVQHARIICLIFPTRLLGKVGAEGFISFSIGMRPLGV